jgi:hypothetical protein
MLEQHPVPQNVTTFQFRLIGDMTLKQFGYLAAGLILAYISFNLPLPFFFRYPLVAVFALGGIGFAFIPVEQRPMDVWFMSFVRSIYSPTQYIWQKENSETKMAQTTNLVGINKLPSLHIPVIENFVNKLFPIPTVSKTIQQHIKTVDTKKSATPIPASSTDLKKTISEPLIPSPKKFVLPHISLPHISFHTPTKKPAPVQPPLASIQQPAYAPVVYPSVVTNAPLPSVSGTHIVEDQQKTTMSSQQSPPPVPRHEVVIEPDDKNTGPSKEYAQLEEKLKELEKQLLEERQQKQDYQKVQQQLVDTLTDKQQLEKEVNELKTKTLQQTQQSVVPPSQPRQAPIQQQSQPTISVITPQVAKNVGIPRITSIPNVISGVVRERNGNLLVGILVTVKDKEDIPVRALKTNKLGQFAASTPLPDGEYILETEDPKGQFLFDLAKVVLGGSVVSPIELLAKSKQDLDRNKLEQALFGKQS